MKKICYLLFIALILVVAGCSSSNDNAKKSDFPNKPVTLIVPYSAGGGTDSVSRAIANAAEDHLGQSIGVVNKTGGGGAVGMAEGANAKNDGYTLTMLTVEVTMLPHLGLTETTYKDFKPIAQFNFDPSSIVVSADAPYDTIEEFLAYAKENPGKVRIGSGGTGTAGHLSALYMEQKTGTEFNHVPFDGGAPAVTALLGGHIEAASVQPAEALAQIEAGKLKVLAIMSNERLAYLPDVPTFNEAGYEFGEIGVWRGLAVPKDTPDEVTTVLTDAFTKAAEEDSFKKFMESNGLGIASGTPEKFEKLMAESDKIYGELISKLDLD